MMNKRGLSEVVTTVLIIMLTVAAIAVIAGFLVPFVKNSLEKSTECRGYEGYFTFEESNGLNCYDNTQDGFVLNGASIKASSKKELAEKIDGFVLVFKNEEGESTPFTVKNGANVEGLSVCGRGESLVVPNPNEMRTYSYKGSKRFDSAEVYTLLKSGRICEDKDSINLVNCDLEGCYV